MHDRVRLAEIFEYEYALEMYKPKAQRRWGYFASWLGLTLTASRTRFAAPG